MKCYNMSSSNLHYSYQRGEGIPDTGSSRYQKIVPSPGSRPCYDMGTLPHSRGTEIAAPPPVPRSRSIGPDTGIGIESCALWFV